MGADASSGARRDAGASDAGRDARVYDGASYACGDVTCAATDYCEITTGGPPPPPDAAPWAGYRCQPLPAQCYEDRTCACAKAWINGCFMACEDDDGHVVSHCFVP